MANLPSAKKRVKQNERNRQRNRSRTSALKKEIRKFMDAARTGDVEVVRERLVAATKKVDQTAAKGTLHRNTAARRKSRMARRLNALQAKQQTPGK
ncbi:MAG TPA: 30S ribosomal protein S20 [Phycisphaerae bacterium]|nr:30S ribosomal protein S20 [Phycisphaerae bacterium]HNU43970.1 30S ribosomal protein S20 [Phycisphaerae bacterium]